MSWSESKPFRAFITDALTGDVAFDLGASPDTLKLALYDDDITPDKDAARADTAYNADEWDNSNEVSEVGQWAAGGVTLTNPAISNPSTGVIMLDADNPSSGGAATLSDVYGGLTYDDTITTPTADQGICYNYFGGANGVSNGTFTVIFHANGLFRVTIS